MCGMSPKLPHSLDLGDFWQFPLDFSNIEVISFEYQPAIQTVGTVGSGSVHQLSP